MDRYSEYGLRGDVDEQLRRAVRDGFKRAGLDPARLGDALEWYRDRGQHLGADVAKLTESFRNFAAERGWATPHLEAALSIYGQIQDHGPAAVLAPAPNADEDAATIARAEELLRADPAGYWRDADLQEAALEARERQAAASPSSAPPDDYAIERRIAQRDVRKYETMMREQPAEYWRSPEAQAAYRDAIERSTAPTPSPPAAAAAPDTPPGGQPMPIPPLSPDPVPVERPSLQNP
jgi:hypothetical protein